jgi:hypothetical protein
VPQNTGFELADNPGNSPALSLQSLPYSQRDYLPYHSTASVTSPSNLAMLRRFDEEIVISGNSIPQSHKCTPPHESTSKGPDDDDLLLNIFDDTPQHDSVEMSDPMFSWDDADDEVLETMEERHLFNVAIQQCYRDSKFTKQRTPDALSFGTVATPPSVASNEPLRRKQPPAPRQPSRVTTDRVTKRGRPKQNRVFTDMPMHVYQGRFEPFSALSSQAERQLRGAIQALLTQEHAKACAMTTSNTELYVESGRCAGYYIISKGNKSLTKGSLAACNNCTEHGRPCVRLEKVDKVVIWMLYPLKEDARGVDADWTDVAYYINP